MTLKPGEEILRLVQVSSQRSGDLRLEMAERVGLRLGFFAFGRERGQAPALFSQFQEASLVVISAPAPFRLRHGHQFVNPCLSGPPKVLVPLPRGELFLKALLLGLEGDFPRSYLSLPMRVLEALSCFGQSPGT